MLSAPVLGEPLGRHDNWLITHALSMPMGLAHGVRLIRNVACGNAVTYDDVESLHSPAAEARQAMEQRFSDPLRSRRSLAG